MRFRRSSMKSRSLNCAMSRPSNRTWPVVGWSRPARRFSNVVLPEPEPTYEGDELSVVDVEGQLFYRRDVFTGELEGACYFDRLDGRGAVDTIILLIQASPFLRLQQLGLFG